MRKLLLIGALVLLTACEMPKPPTVTVQSTREYMGDGMWRIVDPEKHTICYTLFQNSVSCVKEQDNDH